MLRVKIVTYQPSMFFLIETSQFSSTVTPLHAEGVEVVSLCFLLQVYFLCDVVALS